MKSPFHSSQFYDERHRLDFYRAGLHAFATTFILGVAAMTVCLLYFDSGEPLIPMAALIIVVFAGALVFTISLWRGGWYAHEREQVTMNPALRRRAWIGFILGVLIYGGGMFSWQYVLEENDLPGSILFASINALIWGAFMWWLSMRRLKVTEGENS